MLSLYILKIIIAHSMTIDVADFQYNNVLLLIYYRRVIPRAGARNRNKIFELSLQPSNHYCDVIERSTDGENIYDTINDNSILYENQHSNTVSNSATAKGKSVSYYLYVHALN